MTSGLFKNLSLLVLSIYILISFFNVYMIYVEKTEMAKIFRVFLMPTLAVFYFFGFKNHINLIYFAILFFWIADLLLTKSNTKNVIFGFFVYSIANMLLIKEVLLKIKFSDLNYILTIFVFLFYIGLATFFIILTFEKTKSILKDGFKIFSFSRIISAILCVFSTLVIADMEKGAFYIIVGSNLLLLNNLIFSHAKISKKYKFIDLILSVVYPLATLFVVIGVAFLTQL